MEKWDACGEPNKINTPALPRPIVKVEVHFYLIKEAKAKRNKKKAKHSGSCLENTHFSSAAKGTAMSLILSKPLRFLQEISGLKSNPRGPLGTQSKESKDSTERTRL